VCLKLADLQVYHPHNFGAKYAEPTSFGLAVGRKVVFLQAALFY
jgi:hypothetical protein